MPRIAPPRSLAGTLWATCAGVLWGTNGGAGGFLMGQGLSPILVSAFRAALATGLMVAWLAAGERKRPAMSRAAIVWSIVAGLALCANFGFYFTAIQSAGVAVAVILKSTAPLFVVAFAAAARIEPFTLPKLAAGMLIVVGVALVSLGRYEGGLVVPGQGVAAALAAAIAYALFTLAFVAAQRGASASAIVTVAFAVATAGLYAWAGEWPGWPVGWTAAQLAAVAYIALMGTVFAFLAYNKGLAQTEAGVAALVATVEPVIAALLGWWFLAERLDAVQAGGALLILATVSVLNYAQGRRTQSLARAQSVH